MEQQLQSSGQTQNVPVKKKWYKRWWVIVIAVIILYSIGSSAFDDAKKKADENQQASSPAPAEETSTGSGNPAAKPAEPEKATPAVIITSVNLTKEYSDNEVAADAKYKGKLIEVSGKVAGVDNGTFDNEIIVKLSDGQYDFSSTMCYMKDSEHDKVLALKKGQQVTLIGTGDSATLKSPVLKDCWVK